MSRLSASVMARYRTDNVHDKPSPEIISLEEGWLTRERLGVKTDLGAYILFSPGKGPRKESIFHNKEAGRIFSYASFGEKGVFQKEASPNIGLLCAQWKQSLDEQMDPEHGEGKEAFTPFVDIFLSWRKRYMIRGILLSGYTPEGNRSPRSDFQYLFSLERIITDRVNLPMMARTWRLNPRELGIVQLLILDRSNKEIARSLKISINTLKGYMKLLMRKLGVNSRAGIVACIFTGVGPLGDGREQYAMKFPALLGGRSASEAHPGPLKRLSVLNGGHPRGLSVVEKKPEAGMPSSGGYLPHPLHIAENGNGNRRIDQRHPRLDHHPPLKRASA